MHPVSTEFMQIEFDYAYPIGFMQTEFELCTSTWGIVNRKMVNLSIVICKS